MWNAPFRVNAEQASQKVSYTAASAVCGTEFGSQTYVVRLIASTDCYIKFGKTSASSVLTATTSDMFVKADWTPEYIMVTPGQSVAAIRASADGTLYVTEVTR